MSRLNTPTPDAHTHEGAPAKRIDALSMLRRSVCSAFLWEKEFYEEGEEITARVLGLSEQVSFDDLAALAYEVRTTHKLRHMPLLLLAALALRGSGQPVVREAIAKTVRRVDEMGELLAVYAKVRGVEPGAIKPVLPAQVKKGLAAAFRRFDAYQLGKYNQKGLFTLRDVILLVHPNPETGEQAALWKSVLDGTLASPDTWEVGVSGGADKAETFTRLISEGRLGYLALLRNLRGMLKAGVDVDLVRGAILARKGAGNVLPFRFVTAARACPQLEPELDTALKATVAEAPRLDGQTIMLVDVSDSMNDPLSSKSDLTRMDAAATLASILNAESVRLFSFSTDLVEVPPRTGMAGVDAIKASQPHQGTLLGAAVAAVNERPHDRLIVVSDEQSHDHVPDPVATRAYMVNVASDRNGVGYTGRWTHIDGFSENVLRFIHEYERLDS